MVVARLENIADLGDQNSFKEYWPLIVARQHQRHDMDTLRKRTPGDGLIGGTATINADFLVIKHRPPWWFITITP